MDRYGNPGICVGCDTPTGTGTYGGPTDRERRLNLWVSPGALVREDSTAFLADGTRRITIYKAGRPEAPFGLLNATADLGYAGAVRHAVLDESSVEEHEVPPSAPGVTDSTLPDSTLLRKVKMTRGVTKYGTPKTITREVSGRDGRVVDRTVAETTFQVEDLSAEWVLDRPASSTERNERITPSGTRTATRGQRVLAYLGDTRLPSSVATDPGEPAAPGVETVTTTLAYDRFGNVETVRSVGSGADGVISGYFAYDEDGVFPTVVVNALGHVTTMLYNGSFGVPVAIKDPNGRVSKVAVDGFGRERQAFLPAGGSTKVEYGLLTSSPSAPPAPNPYVTRRLQQGGSGTVALELRSFVDQQGRLWATAELGKDQRWAFTRRVFDGLGRVTGQTEPVFTDSAGLRELEVGGVPAEGIDPSTNVGREPSTTISYDNWGRPLVTRQEDDRGRVAESVRQYEVAPSGGQIVRTTSPNCRAGLIENCLPKVIESSVLGEVVSVTSELGSSTTYEFGPFGVLRWIRDAAGNDTFVTSDAYGRRIRLQDPDTGARSFEYDSFGRQRRETDARGIGSTVELDALGRVLRSTDRWPVVITPGSPTPEPRLDVTTWTYDRPGAIGAVATATSPDGIGQSFEYDQHGRLNRTTWSIPLPGTSTVETFTVSSSYDDLNRPSYQELPGPAQVGPMRVWYEYGAGSRLSAVRGQDVAALRRQEMVPSHTFWEEVQHNAAGQTTLEQRGRRVATTNSVSTTTRVFDSVTGQLATVVSTTGTAKLQDLRYYWDLNGNLVQRDSVLPGLPGGTKLFEEFRYDPLNRIRFACVGGCTAPSYTVETKYDSIGNITEKSDVGTYGYASSQPHAVYSVSGPVSGTFLYDAVGNVRERHRAGEPIELIEHTAFNKPSRIRWQDRSDVVQYKYDAGGSRVLKEGPTELVFYIAGSYELHREQGIVDRHRYVLSANGVAVAQVTRGTAGDETIEYLHADHLGSTDLRTTDAGEVNLQTSFDAWGHPRDPRTWTPAPAWSVSDLSVGFTGHEMEREVSLINMQGRTYDPKIGRFLQADPFIWSLLDGQSLNRYSYVLNRPLSVVDPTGYCPEAGGWYAGVEFGSGGPRICFSINGQGGEVTVKDVQNWWYRVVSAPPVPGSPLGGPSIGDYDQTHYERYGRWPTAHSPGLADIVWHGGYEAAQDAYYADRKMRKDAKWVIAMDRAENGPWEMAEKAARTEHDRETLREFVIPMLANFGLAFSRAVRAPVSVWSVDDRLRGVLVETHLAGTEYKDWYNIGASMGGKFPLIDFQKSTVVVSLKTVDTAGRTWYGRMMEHIEDLAARSILVDGVPATKILDIRVPPGGRLAAEPLIAEGRRLGITVLVQEYP